MHQWYLAVLERPILHKDILAPLFTRSPDPHPTEHAHLTGMAHAECGPELPVADARLDQLVSATARQRESVMGATPCPTAPAPGPVILF